MREHRKRFSNKPAHEIPCSVRLATWHLDQWEKFVRLDEQEQKIWNYLCRKLSYNISDNEEFICGKGRRSEVLCENTGEIFTSIKQAAKEFACSSATIRLSIDSKRPVLGGYKFKLIKER